MFFDECDMKQIGLFFVLIIFLFACDKKSEVLTIAAAANTQFAMKEITASFTRDTGIACRTVVGSSGKLTAQIMKGAPYDIFISADLKFPNELYKQELTIGEPQIFAYGQVVLWSASDLIPSIELLAQNEISHIAIANPKTAPYGSAAVEILKHYNIYETVQHKLVYGESISQTNQFIHSGGAQIGFTAKSVVMAPEREGEGNWIELADVYSSINQGIVILRNDSERIEEAQMFYDFILSKKGRGILTKYGYTVPQ